MKQRSYHHGNLKIELIKAGIKLMNEGGEENLSLRKAAEMCNVSHAAPKSHFTNKEAFVEAIKQYVTLEFTKAMEDVVEMSQGRDSLIRDFGLAYIKYFMEHPDIYHFVISQKGIEIRASKEHIYDSSYPPFQIFQVNASKALLKKGVPQQAIPQNILALWAIVNGLAGIYAMTGFHYDGDWSEMAESILSGGLEKKKCD